jgi:hypothetical protein
LNTPIQEGAVHIVLLEYLPNIWCSSNLECQNQQLLITLIRLPIK